MLEVQSTGQHGHESGGNGNEAGVISLRFY